MSDRIGAEATWPTTARAAGQPRATLVAMTVVLVAAVWLRAYDLGGASLWLDEAYSAWFASRSLDYLWTELPQFETHPPFYYTLLHAWTHWFGDGEAALRLPSVIASLATLPIVFLGGRFVWPDDRRPALVATAILALSPLVVWQAHEARPYSLLVLTSAGLLAVALKAIKDSRPTRLMLPLAALTALTVWLHAIGIVIAFTIFAGLSLVALLRGRGGLPFLLAWGGAGLIGVATLAPMADWMLSTGSRWSGSSWLQPPDLRTVYSTFADLVGMRPYRPGDVREPALLLWLVLAGTGLYRLWSNRTSREAMILLLAASAGPFVIGVVVSHLGTPIFLDRTMLPAAVPLAFIAAAGATAFGRWTPVTSALLLGTMAFFVVQQAGRGGQTEDWRGAIAYTAARASPADVVVVTTETGVAVGHYAQRTPMQAPIVALPAPFPAVGMARHYGNGSAAVPGLNADDLARAIELRRRTVWHIQRAIPGSDAELQATLRSQPGLITTTKFDGVIVTRYDPPATGSAVSTSSSSAGSPQATTLPALPSVSGRPDQSRMTPPAPSTTGTSAAQS